MIDFCDLAVFDLFEQRHQPSDFSTKREVRGDSLFARLCLSVQPYVYKNPRGRALQKRLTIPDGEVVDLPKLTFWHNRTSIWRDWESYSKLVADMGCLDLEEGELSSRANTSDYCLK